MNNVAPKTLYLCSYLAYLGNDLDEVAFEAALHYLPRYRNEIDVHLGPDFRLAISAPTHNPLHQSFLHHEQGELLWLQGDFIQPPDERTVKSSLHDTERLVSCLRTFNGSFSGFYLKHPGGSSKTDCVVFTDVLGYEIVYYCLADGGIWVSTSLWPLLRAIPRTHLEVDETSVADIFMIGHTIEDRTLFSKIKVVMPGHIVRIQGDAIAQHQYRPFFERVACTEKQAVARFREIGQAHIANMSAHFDKRDYVLMLSGGRDSRVILNMLLDNDIKPTCLTAIYPAEMRDTQRGLKVARRAGCSSHALDPARADSELDADTYIICDGDPYGSGLVPAVLCRAGAQYGAIAYFGFSGGILSGAGSFKLGKATDYENQPDKLSSTMLQMLYKNTIDPAELLATLLGESMEEYVQRYRSTFDPYVSLNPFDAFLVRTLHQESFRRVGLAWTRGARLGMITTSFFHDIRVLRFYSELPSEFSCNQYLHGKLGYFAAPQIGWLPSTQWYIPQRWEPWLLGPVHDIGKFVRHHLRRIRKPVRRSFPSISRKFEKDFEFLVRVNALDTDRIRRTLQVPGVDAQRIMSYSKRISRQVWFAQGNDLEFWAKGKLFSGEPAQRIYRYEYNA